jgi:hypothetical protein
MITGMAHAPFGVRETERSAFITLSHGPKSPDFDYFAQLDQFLQSWTAKYNDKFGTKITYIPFLRVPMKRVDGELVENDAALLKYGHTVDVRIKKSGTKYIVAVESAGKSRPVVDAIEFDDLIHRGAKLNAVLIPALSLMDDKLRLMPRVAKIKVFESLYDNIDLDIDNLPSTASYETIDL